MELASDVSRRAHRWSGHPSEHFNGNIAEVIVFDNAIATPDRDWVTDYSVNKWGVALE